MKFFVVFLSISILLINCLHGMETINRNVQVYRVYSKRLKKPCTIFSTFRLDESKSKPQAYSYKIEKRIISIDSGELWYHIVFYDENNLRIGTIHYISKNINTLEKLPGFPFDLTHIERKKRKCVVQ